MENTPSIALINSIGENHPSSDIQTDLELLKKRLDDQDATIKCLIQYFQNESEKQKKEIARLKSQLVDLGYIKRELKEKESQHHVFVEINEFYNKKKQEIQNDPNTKPNDKETQLKKLREIVEEARKRRSSKILCNAMDAGGVGAVLGGAVAVGTVDKWAPAIALKLGTTKMKAAALQTLGSVFAGGILVGLVAYGGYLLYVKYSEVEINE